MSPPSAGAAEDLPPPSSRAGACAWLMDLPRRWTDGLVVHRDCVAEPSRGGRDCNYHARRPPRRQQRALREDRRRPWATASLSAVGDGNEMRMTFERFEVMVIGKRILWRANFWQKRLQLRACSLHVARRTAHGSNFVR